MLREEGAGNDGDYKQTKMSLSSCGTKHLVRFPERLLQDVPPPVSAGDGDNPEQPQRLQEVDRGAFPASKGVGKARGESLAKMHTALFAPARVENCRSL
eukprot:1449411-Pleurochrysis_carterae.AAC.1